MDCTIHLPTVLIKILKQAVVYMDDRYDEIVAARDLLLQGFRESETARHHELSIYADSS